MTRSRLDDSQAPLAARRQAAETKPGTPKTSAQHRYHFLDALRGVAAIFVIFRHAPGAFNHNLQFPGSYLAVDFFFCLSGFVLSFSYENKLRRGLGLRDFFVARGIRLYPLAAIGTLLGALGLLASHFVLHSHEYFPGFMLLPDTLLALFLIPTPFHPAYQFVLFPLDGVMWTLFCELVANISYAFLVRTRRDANVLFVSLAVVCLAGLAFICYRFHGFDDGFVLKSLPVGLARVGLSFSLGVLLSRLHTRQMRTRMDGGRAALLALGLTALLIFTFCNQIVLSPWIDLFAVAVLFPATIYFGALVVLGPRATGACSVLGDLSYPLYILHPPFYWFLALPAAMAFASLHAAAATAIMLAYAVLLSALSWALARFYDAPVRRLLNLSYQAVRSRGLVPKQS